ncbi:MAG: sigma-70 family RNA polymerase sigma factor [Candidatus Poribacteria bacterium]|nr:sigma-70 family RNA polymerase sigma factor [Candidatus Poribacteria bacterium]
MKNADLHLIQRVLDGDDTAFSELVSKYHKSVHALVWRKVGDFHIAEEITQDTFLKAYQRLSTLREPRSFASWLYVIAANRCKAWHRKKRLQTQSLEYTSNIELEELTYSNYVIEENERKLSEAKHEVVKKLLAKLQESDRTVVTLYYLGEMTYEEISRFLGVSVSAIKNRLYRARQLLKKEEPMIREALQNYQITPNLTENIMREIARLKPSVPTGGKPLVPWVVAASSAILIVLLLGLGSQPLLHFQQPYSLDAQAETSVELVDTPIVLNLEVKADVQNQLGNTNVLGINENNGQKPDEVLLASAQIDGKDVPVKKQEWIHSGPVVGSVVENLFATDDEELYTVLDAHIYKWKNENTGWQQLSGDIRDYHDRLDETMLITNVPIAKWDNTLYIVLSNLLLASKDDGKTWEIVHSWPPDYFGPRNFVVTEQAFWITYHKGVYRSEDKGKTWQEVDVELFRGVLFFEAIQNKVFAGSYTGLYRWNKGSWERIELPVPEAMIVTKAAATKDRLYVMASLGYDFYDDKAVREGRQRTWWIFRSDDLGNSWKDITPTNAWKLKAQTPDIQLVAAGETIMLMGRGIVRSTNGGDTWLPPQAPHTLPTDIKSYWPSVALNERVFYVVARGLHRSTDGGKTWNKVNITQNRRWHGIRNLISYKQNERKQSIQSTLYGLAGSSIVKTTDQGKSWKHIQVELPMDTSVREDQPWIMQITKSDGVIYAKSSSHYPIGVLRYYRVSEDVKKLVPIQDIPTFDSRELKDYLSKSQNLSIESLQKDFSGANLFFKRLLQIPPKDQELLINNGLGGPFAVSGDTFYMVYNFKLFRWEPGDTEWQDIKQEVTSRARGRHLQLAVSGDTVYVGKRNGHLVVSYDKGDNWIDLTPALPFPVRSYKKIVAAGSAVYVSTDAGTLTSDDGRNWQVVTGTKGTNLIMEELAVDDTTLYGITKDTGIYRLESDSNTWERIITEIPESATVNLTSSGTSLAVTGNALYLGTQFNGMFHFNLEK